MEQINHGIFGNISNTKIPDFYKPGGEPDYRYVVSVFMKFTNADLAKIASISIKSVRYEDDRMPPVLKERIREIMNVCEIVFEMMGNDIEKTQLWFRTRNQMLGNISPRDMIRYGRYSKLLDILMDIKNGNIA